MVEVDYPHGDSTWPNTQSVIQSVWGHLPVDELRMMTHLNAAELYRSRHCPLDDPSLRRGHEYVKRVPCPTRLEHLQCSQPKPQGTTL